MYTNMINDRSCTDTTPLQQVITQAPQFLMSQNREDCKGLLVYLCFLFMDLSASCFAHLQQSLACKLYREGHLSYLFCGMHIIL